MAWRPLREALSAPQVSCPHAANTGPFVFFVRFVLKNRGFAASPA